jgi:hypothetical protein
MEAHVRERPSATGLDSAEAAAEALQWADTVAAEGDFSLAVRWLERADHLLDRLPPRYRERRRAWQHAANGAS